MYLCQSELRVARADRVRRVTDRGDAHDKETNTGNDKADDERDEKLQEGPQAQLPGGHRALLSLVQLILDDVIVQCLLVIRRSNRARRARRARQGWRNSLRNSADTAKLQSAATRCQRPLAGQDGAPFRGS